MEKPAYSKPIPNSKQKSFSHIYRNSQAFQKLLQTPEEGFDNLKSLFIEYFLKRYPERNYIGRINVKNVEKDGKTTEVRTIQDVLKYKQAFEIATYIGSAVMNNDLTRKQNNLSLIGIYSRNRPEFYLSDIACVLYGFTSVPLYDTLGLDNLPYCLEHANLKTVIVSESNARNLMKIDTWGSLETVICCDKLDSKFETEIKKRFKLIYYSDLLSMGKSKLVDYTQIKVNPRLCFTFCYTSGTTGRPKAAMLSHDNFLSFLAGYKNYMKSTSMSAQSNQVHLSLLPMPHVYERCMVAHQISVGGFIVPASGDLLKIMDDLALVKPTLLIAVPRLYNRFVQVISEKVGGEDNLLKLIVADSPVLKNIRQGFGGRIKYMLTGSAPISAKVQHLFGKIMGVTLCQGYGQTENTAGAFITYGYDKQCGTLGPIVGNQEFKLNDIPEMNYTSDDKDEKGNLRPRGEVWIRGKSVILGYYKNPEMTKETITSDGWLKTGDVGELGNNNSLKLIDRRKNIFKLSQGEYISCERVESFYTQSRFVAEAFLHGDSEKDHCVCIVTPNQVEIQKLAKELNINKKYQDLLNDKTILHNVLTDMNFIGKNGGLNSLEMAKNLRLDHETFAIRGLVSSTMKLQRFIAKKYYEKQINEMYAQGKPKL